MPDFNLFEIGGISVIVLVIGIVEAAKKWGLNGGGCQALAMALGTVFVGLSQAISQGMIPEAVIPWINIVVLGLGGGLAASGLFDVIRNKVKPPAG